MNIKTAIQHLIKKQHLSAEQMSEVMQIIISGNATEAQIGGFLIALTMKGETVEEITAAVKIMRKLALPVKIHGAHQVDIVGTGGDQANTFNISTASAFVAAAAGAIVAKHNSRAVSSNSGSSDLLQIAKINVNLNPHQIETCIEKVGLGFMFAPLYHSSLKFAAKPRQELGVRTIFNLLGPLSNPAQVPNAVIGVFAKKWLQPFANVMQELKANHVLIVHSEDGLDEISIAAPTHITELQNNRISNYIITPEQFSLQRASLQALKIKDATESFTIIQAVFNNHPGAARDIVALNAGAAIYAANLVGNLEAGIKKALAVIASGQAKEKFNALVKLTQSFSNTP